MISHKKTAGTSLIEILVVIVVFLIGILAVVNIFPRGFQVLRDTRNLAMATQLVRGESERLKARLGQLPEMILPVSYSFTGTSINITVDQGRTSNNLGPNADALAIDPNTNTPHFYLAGADLGYWPYLTGANVMRRIVGEGGPVPAPRPVGNQLGGLMILQFAPIVYNATYPELFQVYGNDLIRRGGVPLDLNNVRRYFEYYVDESDQPSASIYLPRYSIDVQYRLAMSAWVTTGGTTRSEDLIDKIIPVAAGTGYLKVDLASLFGGGSTFQGAEYDSIRVARTFRQIATFSSNDPYEYKLLDPNLGLILFNPAGYNYYEPRGRSRVPLTARVSYDVYDWRILREEFRVPDIQLPQQRLPVAPLEVAGEIGDDGYPAADFALNEPAPFNDVSNFLVLDMDTGGIVMERSDTLKDGPDPLRLIHVNRLNGVIFFMDRDRDPSNGLQGEILMPGATAATPVDLSGRAVRVLYQAKYEWAVQVMKAPSQYYVTYGLPGVAQYYVGGSNPNVGGGATRIYFPRIDLGKKVSIGEIWYLDSGGNQHLLPSIEFVIRDTPPDPLGPYIDITSIAPDAVQFDLRNPNLGGRGYAVRRVKGASLVVRALNNRAAFKVGEDQAENLENFDKWMRSWKKASTETYLQRGEF